VLIVFRNRYRQRLPNFAGLNWIDPRRTTNSICLVLRPHTRFAAAIKRGNAAE